MSLLRKIIANSCKGAAIVSLAGCCIFASCDDNQKLDPKTDQNKPNTTKPADSEANKKADCEKANSKIAQKEQPIIEVAFVLDTTGSMTGLIEGAKQKIWYIANEIITGEPKPKVRIALIGYRDKGDAYVTKTFQMTDDIDKIYEELHKFKAEGGGDTPENVNQALYEAINKIEWNNSKNVMRSIFLVGDAPPHNEYKDVPTYQELCKQAQKKKIFINTIRCGKIYEAKKPFIEIAALSGGDHFVVAQDGNAQVIATPYDRELAELNCKLVGTVETYGYAASQKSSELANKMATSLADKADAPGADKETRNKAFAKAANRAIYSAKAKKGGSGDLIEQIEKKSIDIDKIDRKLLNPKMQKMSAEEMKKHIASQITKRKEISSKILELSKKRDAFISKNKPKDHNSFDSKMIKSLQKQAKEINVEYKK